MPTAPMHPCTHAPVGDNIYTAKHIARDCGILYADEHIAMEGPDFRAMNADRPHELQVRTGHTHVQTSMQGNICRDMCAGCIW